MEEAGKDEQRLEDLIRKSKEKEEECPIELVTVIFLYSERELTASKVADKILLLNGKLLDYRKGDIIIFDKKKFEVSFSFDRVSSKKYDPDIQRIQREVSFIPF